MRVVQVPRAGGPLELVERDIPEPRAGWVRVKVEACGVCHSDSLVKEGHWQGNFIWTVDCTLVSIGALESVRQREREKTYRRTVELA